jgi:hypothetical protein
MSSVIRLWDRRITTLEARGLIPGSLVDGERRHDGEALGVGRHPGVLPLQNTIFISIITTSDEPDRPFVTVLTGRIHAPAPGGIRIAFRSMTP